MTAHGDLLSRCCAPSYCHSSILWCAPLLLLFFLISDKVDGVCGTRTLGNITLQCCARAGCPCHDGAPPLHPSYQSSKRLPTFFAGHDDHAWFARGRLRRLFQSMVAPRALSGPCPPSESLCDDRKAGGFTHKDPATQRLSHEGTLHSLLLCAHATTAGSCLCSGASCPSASSDSTISCCPTSTCRPASVRTSCL